MKDLQNIRECCTRLDTNEVCSCCNGLLLLRPFFVFNCGHKFHGDCLEKAIVPRMKSERSRHLTMLKQQFEASILLPVTEAGKRLPSSAGAATTTTALRKRNNIKREIEEILAADCLYCGHLIETIDQPFVEDWEQVQVDWD